MSTEVCTAIFLFGIAGLISSLWLVAMKRIPEKLYWLPIVVVSLCLIYSTTLLGNSVVGSDISGEHFVSYTVLQEGHWDIARNYGTPSSTSFVIGWLVPLLSKTLGVSTIWIYKAILPAFLATAPLLLYYIFRRLIKADRAFYTTSFFIGMPMLSLEMGGIAKSMVALPLLLLVLWLMGKEMGTWQKTLLMTLCSVLALLAHYTNGIFIIYFMAAILFTRLIAIPVHWSLFRAWKTPLVSVIVVLIFSCGTFGFYYSRASEGIMITTMTENIPNLLKVSVVKLVQDKIPKSTKIEIEQVRPQLAIPDPTSEESPPTRSPVITEKQPSKAASMPQPILEPSVRLALGLDFLQASLLGKIFRIVQYLTQLAILIGYFYLIIHHRRYNFSSEFVVCMGASLVFLACCALLPFFSYIINASRFYLYSLIFLAPAFVIGCEFTANIGTRK